MKKFSNLIIAIVASTLILGFMNHASAQFAASQEQLESIIEQKTQGKTYAEIMTILSSIIQENPQFGELAVQSYFQKAGFNPVMAKGLTDTLVVQPDVLKTGNWDRVINYLPGQTAPIGADGEDLPIIITNVNTVTDLLQTIVN